MSLVNEMLNDLQKDQKDPFPFQGMVATNVTPRRYSGVVFVTLFIGIVLVGYYLLVAHQEKHKTDIVSEPLMVATSNQTNKINNIETLDHKNPTVVINNNVTQTEEQEAFASEQKSLQPLLSDENPLIPSKANELVKPKITTPSKIETRNSQVKQISRKTLAQKEIALIISQWDSLGASQAFRQLKESLNRFPDISDVWFRSLNFLNLKHPLYYDQLLSESLTLFPKHDSFLFLSAKHLFSLSHFEQAQIQLNKTNSNNWSLSNYRLAALNSQKLNNHSQAINYYQKIISLSSSSGEINMAIGISYEAINQKTMSIKHFEQALLDPKLNSLQKQFIKQRLIENKG